MNEIIHASGDPGRPAREWLDAYLTWALTRTQGVYDHASRDCKHCVGGQRLFAKAYKVGEAMRCCSCGRLESEPDLSSPPPSGAEAQQHEPSQPAPAAGAEASTDAPVAGNSPRWVALVAPWLSFKAGGHYEVRDEWIEDGVLRSVSIFMDDHRRSWTSITSAYFVEIISEKNLPQGWCVNRDRNGHPVSWRHSEYGSVVLITQPFVKEFGGPCRVGQFAAVRAQKACDSLGEALRVASDVPPRRMPAPDSMHGAADEFGGSDYPDPFPRPQTSAPEDRATTRAMPESSRADTKAIRATCSESGIRGLTKGGVYEIVEVPGTDLVSVLGDDGKRRDVPAHYFSADEAPRELLHLGSAVIEVSPETPAAKLAEIVAAKLTELGRPHEAQGDVVVPIKQCHCSRSSMTGEPPQHQLGCELAVFEPLMTSTPPADSPTVSVAQSVSPTDAAQPVEMNPGSVDALLRYVSGVCSATLKHYGPGHNQHRLLEEMGELQVALHHYERGKVPTSAVVTELADVALCLLIASKVYGEHLFFAELRRKAERCAMRLQTSSPMAGSFEQRMIDRVRALEERNQVARQALGGGHE